MSYEGYEQRLCAKGHMWCDDCMQDERRCPQCSGKAVWTHSVDCTNGVCEDENGKPYQSTVPWPLEVERYEERTIQVPIYKIPVTP